MGTYEHPLLGAGCWHNGLLVPVHRDSRSPEEKLQTEKAVKDFIGSRDCRLRYATPAIPGGETPNRKGCSDFIGSSLVFYLASGSELPSQIKKKAAATRQPFLFGVEDGIRTHDLRNHNPTF
jgi:hypothetical protein